jgi:uncharacterized membrane protein (DUF485 family)
MLRIVEQTPTRLVLKDQHQVMAVLAGISAFLSAVSLVTLITQGTSRIFTPIAGEANLARIVAFLIFMLACAIFFCLGIWAAVHFSRGTTCILDKNEGTLTLETLHLFRMKRHDRPIYGLSHVDAETNAHARAYGVFLVLRSGEKIPLAAISMLEQDALESLLKQIRGFLRG